MKKILLTILIVLTSTAITTAEPATSSITEFETWIVPAAHGYNMFNPDYASHSSAFPPISPLATHVGSSTATEILEIWNGRQEVLKLNEPGIYFRLPAAIQAQETKITLEIEYFNRYSNLESEIKFWGMKNDKPVNGYNEETIIPVVTESSWDLGWLTQSSEFVIPVEMDYFVIEMLFSNYPESYNISTESPYIDNVTIRTESIPEPTTIMLLSLGSLLLRKIKSA